MGHQVSIIRRECEKKYPGQFYYTINKDKDFTGNLEIQLSKAGEDSNAIFFHQKNGKRQGFPSQNWDAFWNNLETTMVKLEQGPEAAAEVAQKADSNESAINKRFQA